MRAPERVDTERLRLRKPAPSDAEAIFAYARDPEVTRYVGWPRHEDVEETRAFLAHSAAEWQRGPAGAYRIGNCCCPGGRPGRNDCLPTRR